MTSVTLTPDQFSTLMQVFALFAMAGGAFVVLACVDLFGYIDRIRWHRRRRARLLRRRAKAATHA